MRPSRTWGPSRRSPGNGRRAHRVAVRALNPTARQTLLPLSRFRRVSSTLPVFEAEPRHAIWVGRPSRVKLHGSVLHAMLCGGVGAHCTTFCRGDQHLIPVLHAM